MSLNNTMDSEIARLAAEVNARRGTAEVWDTWNIRLLFIAGLAATLLAVTAVGVSRSNRNLVDASDRLDKAKDRKLQADLKAKDDEIAALENESAQLTASNLRLEAAISPRRLSPRQKDSLSKLEKFANRLVEIKSYSNDAEGLVLATEIINALGPKTPIRDNRLTMQTAGSVSFGVLVEGSDKELVSELKRILSLDGNLTKGAEVSPLVNRGFSATVQFGVVGGNPAAATITVGLKPIK